MQNNLPEKNENISLTNNVSGLRVCLLQVKIRLTSKLVKSSIRLTPCQNSWLTKIRTKLDGFGPWE